MTSWMIVTAVVAQSGLAGQTPPPGFNQGDAVLAASYVQAYYNRTQDFKAKFKQVYTKAFHGAEAPRYGYLWVKKPGLMRWDYTSPRKKQLICDGSKIWIYDPGYQQVFWNPLGTSAIPSAVSFLWGKGNITGDFWVKLVTGSKYQAPNTKVIWLQPKQTTGSFKHILFVVDAKTHMVVKSLVYDHLDNNNLYEFSSQEANTNPPASLFTFTPPKGVRVIQGTNNVQP
jgi:outer membrane lipoprotein carrier protein